MRKAITRFEVYEDSTRYLGVAKATLPTLTTQTVTVGGAGMSGKVEVPIAGHYEAMELSLDFEMFDTASVALCEPRKHQIELRADRIVIDDTTGEQSHQAEKHVFVVYPKSTAGGAVAQSDQHNGSGTYAVHYWAAYIAGKKIQEIEPAGGVAYFNGTDYLKTERKNIGLS